MKALITPHGLYVRRIYTLDSIAKRRSVYQPKFFRISCVALTIRGSGTTKHYESYNSHIKITTIRVGDHAPVTTLSFFLYHGVRKQW